MEECDDDSAMLEREGESRRQRFFQEGYRESIEEGKGRLLQAGFDVGFSLGATAGLTWGRMMAIEKTLRTYSYIQGGGEGDSILKEIVAEMTSLLGKVDPRQAMLSAMKEVGRSILSKTPDEAEIRATLDREPDEDQEHVIDEELSIASKLLPELVEEGNRERVMANSTIVDLRRLEQEVGRLSMLTLSRVKERSLCPDLK